jgi:hypothetical protein
VNSVFLLRQGKLENSVLKCSDDRVYSSPRNAGVFDFVLRALF